MYSQGNRQLIGCASLLIIVMLFTNNNVQGIENACKSSERGKCICELADGSGKTIDLSALVSETAKSPFTKSKAGYAYYYAFCNALAEQEGECKGASVCQISASISSSANLGNPETTRFEMRTDSNLHPSPSIALVTDAKDSDGNYRRSIAFLNCDQNKASVTFEPNGQNGEEDKYTLYPIEFTGSVFCPVGSSGGLSGGSIVLIIFFCLIAVYFGGGFLFSTFVLKRQGAERIPNVTFWVELPRMAKDGFFFTWNSAKMCCNRN